MPILGHAFLTNFANRVYYYHSAGHVVLGKTISPTGAHLIGK